MHQYDNIPAILKHRTNWVVWGVSGAATKSPFNPVSLLKGGHYPAKAGVRQTWGSYQSTVECVRRGLAQGIGYEFDGFLYGVDLDHVIDDAGILIPQAKEIVDQLASYTEISPSGTGLHIFVFAQEAKITRHRKKDCFCEIYNEGRYFTVTGNTFGGSKIIEERTKQLQTVHDKFLQTDLPQKVIRLPTPAAAQSSEQEQFLRIGLMRDKAFSALWFGQRRHGNESSDDQALMNKLAYWLSADTSAMIRAFMQSPHYEQKDEAHKKKCQRSDYLPNTAQKSSASICSTAASDHERWQQKQKRARDYAR